MHRGLWCIVSYNPSFYLQRLSKFSHQRSMAMSSSSSSLSSVKSIAIVTGGRSGIGKAIVEKIATFDDIDHVLAVSRSITATNTDFVTTNNNNKDKIIPVAADIGTSAGRNKIIEALSQFQSSSESQSQSSSSSQQPFVRFLIHSAGIIDPIKSILDITEDDFQTAIAVNLQGPVLLTTALYPYMMVKEKEETSSTSSTLAAAGRVLHISSGAAHGPPPIGWSLYGITKAAFYQAFQTLDKEFVHLSTTMNNNNTNKAVRVGSVKPGIIDTDMQSVIRASDELTMPMVSTFIELKANADKNNNNNNNTDNTITNDPNFKARPPPKNALDRPENVACFVEWLLLHTTDDEFANVHGKDPIHGREYDIRDPKWFPKWIPPENLPPSKEE